jgi:hypothetical protein
MKRSSLVFFILTLFAASALAQSQSLGDLAKKEKERRKQVSSEVKVITNLDTAKYRSGAVSTTTFPAPPAPKPEGEGTSTPGTSPEGSRKAEKADKDEPRDMQGRTESWWRQTMSDARQKVKELENAANVIALRIADLQTQFYREANGFRQQDIQREIQKGFYEQDLTKENLAKAKRELEDLEKEARKSGALPGWLSPS